jgi:hypothetical protein
MEQLYIGFLSLVSDRSNTFVDEFNYSLIGKKSRRSIKPASKVISSHTRFPVCLEHHN